MTDELSKAFVQEAGRPLFALDTEIFFIRRSSWKTFFQSRIEIFLDSIAASSRLTKLAYVILLAESERMQKIAFKQIPAHAYTTVHVVDNEKIFEWFCDQYAPYLVFSNKPAKWKKEFSGVINYPAEGGGFKSVFDRINDEIHF